MSLLGLPMVQILFGITRKPLATSNLRIYATFRHDLPPIKVVLYLAISGIQTYASSSCDSRNMILLNPVSVSVDNRRLFLQLRFELLGKDISNGQKHT